MSSLHGPSEAVAHARQCWARRPAACCHNSCLLHVAALHPANKSRCWPQVVNRDELLNSLEDIATAFDMRVRPYSATSGQPFPLLTPLPTAVVMQTFRHFGLLPPRLCKMQQSGPKHCSGLACIIHCVALDASGLPLDCLAKPYIVPSQHAHVIFTTMVEAEDSVGICSCQLCIIRVSHVQDWGVGFAPWAYVGQCPFPASWCAPLSCCHCCTVFVFHV